MPKPTINGNQNWFCYNSKVGSLKAEFIGWFGTGLLGITLFFIWSGTGYWIWKAYPEVVQTAIMMSFFACCGGVPLILLILLLAGLKKQPSVELIRLGQICIPLIAVCVATWQIPHSAARFVDFEQNLKQRHQVVEQMRSAQFEENESSKTESISISDVAAGNVVYLYRSDVEFMVFFPTLPYFIDNHAGFVYSDSGNEPPRQSFYEVTHIERLEKHWFWIRTT